MSNSQVTKIEKGQFILDSNNTNKLIFSLNDFDSSELQFFSLSLNESNYSKILNTKFQFIVCDDTIIDLPISLIIKMFGNQENDGNKIINLSHDFLFKNKYIGYLNTHTNVILQIVSDITIDYDLYIYYYKTYYLDSVPTEINSNNFINIFNEKYSIQNNTHEMTLLNTLTGIILETNNQTKINKVVIKLIDNSGNNLTETFDLDFYILNRYYKKYDNLISLMYIDFKNPLNTIIPSNYDITLKYNKIVIEVNDSIDIDVNIYPSYSKSVSYDNCCMEINH
jgi:hypothetical protein